jgi:hypothetical protein
MKCGSAIKFPNGAGGDDQRCDAIAYGCADNRKIGLRFRSQKTGRVQARKKAALAQARDTIMPEATSNEMSGSTQRSRGWAPAGTNRGCSGCHPSQVPLPFPFGQWRWSSSAPAEEDFPVSGVVCGR